MLPPRRYERLSRFLLRLIDSTVEPQVAGDAAFALGREFGAETAAEIAGVDVQTPVKLAPHAVIAWMDEAGYNVTARRRGQGHRGRRGPQLRLQRARRGVPRHRLPFDRGTVCGMLGVEPSAHTQTHSMSAGDAYCRHEFRL